MSLSRAYEDEMAANICGTGDKCLVCRVKVPDVARLQDQRDDPVYACDNDVQGEWSSHVPVLTPYCVTVVLVIAVGRRIEGIIEGCDNHKEPGDDCEDLVGKQRTFIEL